MEIGSSQLYSLYLPTGTPVTELVTVPSSACNAMASQLAFVTYNAVYGRTMDHRACLALFCTFPHANFGVRWRPRWFSALCIAMSRDLGADSVLLSSFDLAWMSCPRLVWPRLAIATACSARSRNYDHNKRNDGPYRERGPGTRNHVVISHVNLRFR